MGCNSARNKGNVFSPILLKEFLQITDTNFRHDKLHSFPVLRGFSYLWQKFSKKIQTERISSHRMERKAKDEEQQEQRGCRHSRCLSMKSHLSTGPGSCQMRGRASQEHSEMGVSTVGTLGP